jgi:MFS family permease
MLQSVFALSVSATSLVMLLRPGSFAVTSPIGGTLATRIGERPVAVFGSAAIAIALLLLGLGGAADLLWVVIVGLIVQGIGNGTAQPTITATMSNSVDEADLGIAAAAQRMAFQVGSALGISTLTAIYGGSEQASDFLTAYLVGAGIGVAALVFATMMRSTPHDLEPLDDERVPAVVHGALPGHPDGDVRAPDC